MSNCVQADGENLEILPKIILCLSTRLPKIDMSGPQKTVFEIKARATMQIWCMTENLDTCAPEMTMWHVISRLYPLWVDSQSPYVFTTAEYVQRYPEMLHESSARQLREAAGNNGPPHADPHHAARMNGGASQLDRADARRWMCESNTSFQICTRVQ